MAELAHQCIFCLVVQDNGRLSDRMTLIVPFRCWKRRQYSVRDSSLNTVCIAIAPLWLELSCLVAALEHPADVPPCSRPGLEYQEL